MSDILQRTTGTEITFIANTPRAATWLLDHYGSSTVTYRFPNRNQMAADLRKKAKAAKLTVLPL